VDRYDGFREFLDAHGRALSRTAFFLTGDHAAAEDLLQEALTRTVRRWRKVASSSPERYVRQVMLNEARSRWRRRFRAGGVEYTTESVSDQPSGSDVAADTVERTVLAAALRKLGVRQRAVLYLRFYEDLSEAETARLLGCSVGTVKSQTHDALARLREVAPELLPVHIEEPMEVSE
jgi:RNA polymerase sigma-70 factor (sigma-E family)